MPCAYASSLRAHTVALECCALCYHKNRVKSGALLCISPASRLSLGESCRLQSNLAFSSSGTRLALTQVGFDDINTEKNEIKKSENKVN